MRLWRSRTVAGNLLLLKPLGILLRLLFVKLRRPWPLIWRVAAISVSIEVIQLITRARSVDVDDVILNVTGAAVAFSIFSAVARFVRGSRQACGSPGPPRSRTEP